MPSLRETYRFQELSRADQPLIAESYRFDAAKYPSLAGFRIVHRELALLEAPLALARRIHVAAVEQRHRSLQADLTLCWNGFGEALDLLFRAAEAFQRPLPSETLVDTAERHQIGLFGLAWSWEGRGAPEVLGFVRFNLVVFLQGHDAGDSVLNLAREMDGELLGLRTAREYADAASDVFAEVIRREGPVPKVPAGGRLALGRPPGDAEALYFLTTSGSVNREPAQPDSWYYRAGANRGRQVVTAFRTDGGMLPQRARLSVDVI